MASAADLIPDWAETWFEDRNPEVHTPLMVMVANAIHLVWPSAVRCYADIFSPDHLRHNFIERSPPYNDWYFFRDYQAAYNLVANYSIDHSSYLHVVRPSERKRRIMVTFPTRCEDHLRLFGSFAHTFFGPR